MDVADPPTDAALAARRDRAAFDELADRHARPLAAWLLRRLPPEDAEEVLPAVLRRARRSAGSFRGGDYRAWLFQIARTTLADWLRRYRRPAAGGPDHAAAVAECLARLDDRERELVRARFGDPDAPPVAPILARLRECVADQEGGRPLLLPTIPEDPTELPGWLERQVAGPDLGRLIAGLSAVHGPTVEGPDLATALGADRPAVLAKGLGVLPEARLWAFLRHPALLAALQDAVAESVSPYWDDRFDHPTLARMVREARQEVFEDQRPRRRVWSGGWYRRPWFVAVASAGIVLFTVILHRPPVPPAWGLARPGVVSRGDTRVGHLTALADAAAEWDDRPRETPAELRRALHGMRDGCTAVLAAPHDRLAGDDRAWLFDRCLIWGARLDRLLADLQTGRPAEVVRREADATVAEVVRSLRERAQAP